jgi:hypothetical protein
LIGSILAVSYITYDQHGTLLCRTLEAEAAVVLYKRSIS